MLKGCRQYLNLFYHEVFKKNRALSLKSMGDTSLLEDICALEFEIKCIDMFQMNLQEKT